MAGFPHDRSFHTVMSEELLRCACAVRRDNKIVPFEELLSSDTLLTEVGKALCKKGWPWRAPDELRQELIRMHARWMKRKPKSEASRRLAAKNPYCWIDESEDEDDLFMPSSKPKRTASSKGKNVASSKGKNAASTEDDDDDFMPSSKSKRAASSKGK